MPQFNAGVSDYSMPQAHEVLRNTYLLLALSMVPTFIGAFLGLHLQFQFLAVHPILGMLLMLGVGFGLIYGIMATADSAPTLAVGLMLGFTFLMGLILGPTLQMALHFANGPLMIMEAALGTAGIFLGMATLATTSKRDFSFLGKFLFVGLLLGILGLVASYFVHIPVFSMALSGLLALVFSGYLLYDVSRVVQGGETNYIRVALSLYLDLYNLFINLLDLLMQAEN